MTTTSTDRELLDGVLDELRHLEASGTVLRTTVGDRLVAVELDGPDGHRMGVAHRPPGETGASLPSEPLALGRWAFDPPGDRPLERALGLAALNALSAPYIRWRRGDPMAALADGVARIATVGLFRPAFRKFDAVEVRVIEREPVDGVDPPPGVSVSVHSPAEAESAIEGADVLFVTGSSLVYGGTAAYLRASVDVPSVVLIGATASFLPGPAFEAGVTMLAGARVTAPTGVRTGIQQGQCGADLHDQGLEKVYVAAEARPHGLDLDGRPAGRPGEAGDGPS